MLTNVSYNNPEVSRKIDALVGRPYTLRKRWHLGGIGSPKLTIRESSTQIRNLLLLDNNRSTCNIELRPGGIVLGFRSLLESYALVVPYFKLSLLKGDLGVYTIHKDQYFVRVEADTKAAQAFFVKMLHLKANWQASEFGTGPSLKNHEL